MIVDIFLRGLSFLVTFHRFRAREKTDEPVTGYYFSSFTCSRTLPGKRISSFIRALRIF